MSRGKEGDPLNGVWSKAYAEQILLSTCPRSSDLKCGQIETTLPRKLREYLKLGSNGTFPLKMSVMASDGEIESLANILVEVEGSRVAFLVRTRKVIWEDGKLQIIRKLKVEKRPPKGEGEVVLFAHRDKVHVEALRQVMNLWAKKFGEVDTELLCGTCSTQVDRLPRPVI